MAAEDLYTGAMKLLQKLTKSFAPTPRKFALKDWKIAFIETKNAITAKNIGLLAAGIAYFLTFALFPSIAAAVAIASFVMSPEQITAAATSLQAFLPDSIAQLVSGQLTSALKNPSSSIVIAVVGILIALFSISGAVGNVIKAVNSLYEVEESRSFIHQRLVSAAQLGLAAVAILLVFGLLLLNETLLTSWGVPAWTAWTILVVRWVIIAGIVTIGLSIFYRYAPNRRNPQWQWVTWGSLMATIIWLLGTTLFFVYARFFAHYSDSYSVFAGIIVLMIWLNLTAFALLLGATINHKLETQTFARTKKK